MEGWRHSVKGSTLQILGPWFLLDWVSNIFVVVVVVFQWFTVSFQCTHTEPCQTIPPLYIRAVFQDFWEGFQSTIWKNQYFSQPTLSIKTDFLEQGFLFINTQNSQHSIKVLHVHMYLCLT